MPCSAYCALRDEQNFAARGDHPNASYCCAVTGRKLAEVQSLDSFAARGGGGNTVRHLLDVSENGAVALPPLPPIGSVVLGRWARFILVRIVGWDDFIEPSLSRREQCGGEANATSMTSTPVMHRERIHRRIQYCAKVFVRLCPVSEEHIGRLKYT